MKAIATILAIIAFSALLSLVLINWMMGCGEVEYHADGTFVTGECLVIPYTPVKGTWK
jgi:hypothetical protein